MNALTILLLTINLMILASASPGKEYYDLNNAEQLFEGFIKDYNRHYKDEQDKQAHFEAFKKSLQTINESNARDPHATFGINQFADYTPEEQRQMFGLKRPENK